MTELEAMVPLVRWLDKIFSDTGLINNYIDQKKAKGEKTYLVVQDKDGKTLLRWEFFRCENIDYEARKMVLEITGLKEDDLLFPAGGDIVMKVSHKVQDSGTNSLG